MVKPADLEGRTTNNRVLNGALAGIPAFGYLLFLTGKAYSDAYYSTIGIPSGIVNFSFWDCIYLGTKDFRFLIALAFAAMFAGFVLYLTEPDQWYYESRYPSSAYYLYVVYLLLFVGTLLWVILVSWLTPTIKTTLAYTFSAASACLAVAGFSIIILFDKALLTRIKEGRFISKIFPWAIGLALVFFPYTSADAWGRIEGIIAKDSYPLVELYAPHQVIDDIQWEPASTNSCRTVDDLYLLFSNQQYLIVESVTDRNSLYVINIDDILSMKIVSPEK